MSKFYEYIDESVWSDIQDRNSGEAVRKEDNVDILPFDDFVEYVKSHYSMTNPKEFREIEYEHKEQGFNILIIPVERVHTSGFTYTYDIWVMYDSHKDIIMNISLINHYFVEDHPNIPDILGDEYAIEMGHEQNTHITLKDGELQNHHVLDVLDKCLSIIKKPMIKKKLNESLWSDIQDRNSGEVIRKEDEIPEDIKKALDVYMNIFAYKEAFAGNYTLGSYPDFRAFIKDFANAPKIQTLDFNMNELLDYVKENWNDVVLPRLIDTVTKINGEVDKAIDKLWDETHKPDDVNESLWSDIQDRNSGEMVRKEDTIIESFEELRDYIQKKVDDTEEGGIVNLRNLDLSNLWSLDKAFSGLHHLYRIKGIDVTGWKTSTIRHMEYVFQWAARISSIIGLETWDVSSVSTMKGMFYKCRNVLELNVGGWDVSGVKDMSVMFSGCDSLKKLDIGEWQIKYEYGILMEGMFSGCKSLTELNIGKWNISKVEKMTSMFSGCESLTNIPIENWKLTSKTRSIAYMFAHCKSLTKVPIEHWNVKSIKDMSGVFDGCTGLTEIDLSNWNLGVVPKDMRGMFSGCENLTEMHIENWNVEHVSNMSDMFSHCKSLTKLHLEKWDVSNVVAMSSMFEYCENLKVLNIENWKVNNVEKIQRMFQDSKNLPELDLSKWEFRRLKEKDYVFRDSSMKDYFIRYWDKAWRIFKPKVTSDEMGEDDFLLLKQFMEHYDSIISQKYHYVGWTNNCEGCIDYLETNKKNHSGSINNGPVEDRTYNKIIKFVKDNWGDCKNIQEFMDKYLSHLKDKSNTDINESLWSDIQDRNSDEVTRKEDEMSEDDFHILREISKMFSRGYQFKAGWSNNLKSFIRYIDGLRKDHFLTMGSDVVPDKVYKKIIKFVEDHWEYKDWGIIEFSKKYLRNLNECEGVPGGATPANVGGMGAITFPGPDGTPGSGDLPSPTGKVYQQVAPFGIFVNSLYGKRKKKKKKKFRKEDEPCVHSPNAKVYDYVDDFREYVDRTYTIMNRNK